MCVCVCVRERERETEGDILGEYKEYKYRSVMVKEFFSC